MQNISKLTIGTRGSRLALTQANWVRERLTERYPDIEVSLKIIKTKGDKILDTPLGNLGGKGLFVKEIEEELLRGGIDLAVHSMKDMPLAIPEGLRFAAITERESGSDVLISRNGEGLKDLRRGARIGTGSLRRISQLKNMRPDLEIVRIRGNLDTRIKKLKSEDLDAIVVAAAGIRRMGWEDQITEYLDVNEIIPAAGQGALAIEAVCEDVDISECLGFLNHEQTSVEVRAERAFLGVLGGGCQVPVAVHGIANGGKIDLLAMVAREDGTKVIRGEMRGDVKDPEDVGIRLGEDFLRRGAGEILRIED